MPRTRRQLTLRTMVAMMNFRRAAADPKPIAQATTSPAAPTTPLACAESLATWSAAVSRPSHRAARTRTPFASSTSAGAVSMASGVRSALPNAPPTLAPRTRSAPPPAAARRSPARTVLHARRTSRATPTRPTPSTTAAFATRAPQAPPAPAGSACSARASATSACARSSCQSRSVAARRAPRGNGVARPHRTFSTGSADPSRAFAPLGSVMISASLSVACPVLYCPPLGIRRGTGT